MTILSIIGGRILRWIIFPFPYLIVLPLNLKLLTLIVCIIGGLMGYFIFKWYSFYYLRISSSLQNFNQFFSFIWFIPYLSTVGVNFLILDKGYKFGKRFDFGWNEYLIRSVLFNYIYAYSIYLIKYYYINYYKRFFSMFILLILIVVIL